VQNPASILRITVNTCRRVRMKMVEGVLTLNYSAIPGREGEKLSIYLIHSPVTTQ
jgi:hypothetical protein